MHFFKSLGLALMIVVWAVGVALAASPNPSLLQAKQEAAAKGYTFITNHDEIVTKAKKEGKLRVTANLERSTIKATTAAFKKKYPFIDDIYVAETTGTEAAQRMLLALKSGASRGVGHHPHPGCVPQRLQPLSLECRSSWDGQAWSATDTTVHDRPKIWKRCRALQLFPTHSVQCETGSP